MHLRLLKHLLSTQILLSKGIRPFGPERKAIPTTMLELQKNLLSVSVRHSTSLMGPLASPGRKAIICLVAPPVKELEIAWMP